MAISAVQCFVQPGFLSQPRLPIHRPGVCNVSAARARGWGQAIFKRNTHYPRACRRVCTLFAGGKATTAKYRWSPTTRRGPTCPALRQASSVAAANSIPPNCAGQCRVRARAHISCLPMGSPLAPDGREASGRAAYSRRAARAGPGYLNLPLRRPWPSSKACRSERWKFLSMTWTSARGWAWAASGRCGVPAAFPAGVPAPFLCLLLRPFLCPLRRGGSEGLQGGLGQGC